jgi:hypothetical protein
MSIFGATVSAQVKMRWTRLVLTAFHLCYDQRLDMRARPLHAGWSSGSIPLPTGLALQQSASALVGPFIAFYPIFLGRENMQPINPRGTSVPGFGFGSSHPFWGILAGRREGGRVMTAPDTNELTTVLLVLLPVVVGGAGPL